MDPKARTAVAAFSETLAELDQIRPLLVLLDRLKKAHLAVDVVWLFPDNFLPGHTVVYGRQVVRAPVDAPMIAHRS